MTATATLRLAGGHTVDGQVVDIDLDDRTGTIVGVAPAGSVPAQPDSGVEDVAGHLVLPAPAEPHAHLDKALVGRRVPNPTGDLMGAVEGWCRYRATLAREDLVERARRAALMCLAAGATAVRTHVDVGQDLGLLAVEALVAVRGELAAVMDIQVVALVGVPLSGRDGGPNRRLLAAAIEVGADLVGGAPHVDQDPLEATRACTDVARAYGVRLDLHTDETLDETKLGLLDLVDEVARGGLTGPVAASHCVSLGMQDPDVQQKIANLVAEAGIAVITNPQTNLFLQGRQYEVATPRGLTALRPLLEAGVILGAGGDNVRDPFNPMGRGDPLETATLLVTAGHLEVEEAWVAVSAGARRAMGLRAGTVAVGEPAELLVIEAASLPDAIASCTEARTVVHGGRIVVRTEVRRTFSDADGSAAASSRQVPHSNHCPPVHGQDTGP